MNESFAKYLSGLLDSDGSIYFNFVNPTRDDQMKFNLSLKISLASSRSVDTQDFVYSLPNLIGFGTSCRDGKDDRFSRWTVTSRRDLEMLVPRISKHMVVKARHMKRLFEKWREMRGTALSEEDCEKLRIFSMESRVDSGPLKPKNHPSWSWLAGYLDGNGSYRSGRVRSGTYNGKPCYRTQCSVHASCHINDAAVLEFIHKAHGGSIVPHSGSSNCMVWERNLGKSQHSFAVRFLPKLVKHARIKKYKIEQMIAFHHQQRLTTKALKGEVIV